MSDLKTHFKLPTKKLRFQCDYSHFSYKGTHEAGEFRGFLGQESAEEAINFGLKMQNKDYNIFVAGPTGSGKTTFTRELIEQFALKRDKPTDWVYVNSFKSREHPKAFCLPAGWGNKFQESMSGFLEQLIVEIPKVFSGEDYEKRRTKIYESFYKLSNAVYLELERFSRDEGFTISRTGNGLASVPLIDGHAVSEEEYDNLLDEIKADIQERNRKVQVKMNETMRRFSELDNQTKIQMAALEKEVGLEIIAPLIREMKTLYASFEEIAAYLDEVEKDLIENLELFVAKEDAQSPGLLFKRFTQQNVFNRYLVNLLVDHENTQGAPVIEEKNPTFSNLFGSIEYEGEFGVLSTDFTRINKGALHQANGGYLLLQAIDILNEPAVWNTLKRSLKNQKIVIESVFRNLNLGGAVTLDPEPIPLSLKIILFGEPYLFQLLFQYDEDFRKLFKIKADFDTEMELSPAYIDRFAAFVGSVCKREKLLHFSPDGVGRMVEYSARLVEHQKKLSTLLNHISEIIIEAAYWAKEGAAELVHSIHVDKALKEKTSRANRIERKVQEQIQDGTLMIATQGAVVGQINGLAIYSLGDHTFGKPTKITAKTFMGDKGLVNIERESRMSGQIHDKGILTLSGYLGGQYAQDKPLSLSASLTFEQLYGGIEGDSASSVELYALLSSLAKLPIDQSIAVTGSVNQMGEIQPVGGINQKIEGFYKTCKVRNLTGKQGVIIPQQNVENLMLDPEIVDAVNQGLFSIWAISHIDQGIEILMDLPAGIQNEEGEFPPNTVHFLVEKQLSQWINKRRTDPVLSNRKQNPMRMRSRIR